MLPSIHSKLWDTSLSSQPPDSNFIRQRMIFQEDHLPQCCKAVLNSIQLLSSFLCFSNFTGYDVFIGVQGSMWLMASASFVISHHSFLHNLHFCQSNCTKLLQQLILKRRSRGTLNGPLLGILCLKTEKFPWVKG